MVLGVVKKQPSAAFARATFDLFELSRSQKLCRGPNDRTKQLGEFSAIRFALAGKSLFFTPHLETQRRPCERFVEKSQISAGWSLATAKSDEDPVQRFPYFFRLGENGSAARRKLFRFSKEHRGGLWRENCAFRAPTYEIAKIVKMFRGPTISHPGSGIGEIQAKSARDSTESKWLRLLHRYHRQNNV
jgi:hypothetical protein